MLSLGKDRNQGQSKESTRDMGKADRAGDRKERDGAEKHFYYA